MWAELMLALGKSSELKVPRICFGGGGCEFAGFQRLLGSRPSLGLGIRAEVCQTGIEKEMGSPQEHASTASQTFEELLGRKLFLLGVFVKPRAAGLEGAAAWQNVKRL